MEIVSSIAAALVTLLGIAIAILALSGKHRDHTIWVGFAAGVCGCLSFCAWLQNYFWKQDLQNKDANTTSPQVIAAPNSVPTPEAQALLDWAKLRAYADYEALLAQAKEEARIPLEELRKIRENAEDIERSTEGLCGFIFYTSILIEYQPQGRRQYLFDFGSLHEERFSVYITKDGIFTMCIYDSAGEPHSVKLPLGDNGIPTQRKIDLGFEVGIGSSLTVLRLVVDGEVRGSTRLPFTVDIGKLDIPNGIVGGDLNRSNPANFYSYFAMRLEKIPTNEGRIQIHELLNNTILKDQRKESGMRFDGSNFMKFNR